MSRDLDPEEIQELQEELDNVRQELEDARYEINEKQDEIDDLEDKVSEQTNLDDAVDEYIFEHWGDLPDIKTMEAQIDFEYLIKKFKTKHHL